MFVAKNSDATSWHELLQERSACFPQSFVRQPNDPECTQLVRNGPNRQFRVQWGRSGAFVAKNSDATSFTNFCTVRSILHRVSCGNQTVPNAPKWYKTHQKRGFRVQWVGSGAFVAKNSNATLWHELLH